MDETSGGTLATLELAHGACCAFGSGIVHHNDTVIVKALVCVRASARYSVACCVACVLWHDACEACHAARRMAMLRGIDVSRHLSTLDGLMDRAYVTRHACLDRRYNGRRTLEHRSRARGPGGLSTRTMSVLECRCPSVIEYPSIPVTESNQAPLWHTDAERGPTASGQPV